MIVGGLGGSGVVRGSAALIGDGDADPGVVVGQELVDGSVEDSHSESPGVVVVDGEVVAGGFDGGLVVAAVGDIAVVDHDVAGDVHVASAAGGDGEGHVGVVAAVGVDEPVGDVVVVDPEAAGGELELDPEARGVADDVAADGDISAGAGAEMDGLPCIIEAVAVDAEVVAAGVAVDAFGGDAGEGVVIDGAVAEEGEENSAADVAEGVVVDIESGGISRWS